MIKTSNLLAFGVIITMATTILSIILSDVSYLQTKALMDSAQFTASVACKRLTLNTRSIAKTKDKKHTEKTDY